MVKMKKMFHDAETKRKTAAKEAEAKKRREELE